jgi:GH3 auxin-responsive promoter
VPDFKVMTANLAWMASCLPAFISFRRAIRDPGHAQRVVLRKILARNASTEFGRKHGFADIRSVADFRARVPESDFEAISPFIDRACAGEPSVLTSDPIRLFEKTSGSSGAAKYIPCTDSLRREFQNAVRAWIFDLYRYDPKLLLGQSYWLITPLSRDKEMTPGDIPVGFENDADYLGTLERKIAEALFVVPGELARVSDIESSLYLTLRFLIQSENLTLISVWNPSYLSLLMDRFDSWAVRLLADLEKGNASLPNEQNIPLSLIRKLRAQPKRARALRQILERTGKLRPAEIWPRLRLISCWTDAAARQSLAGVSQRFPQVRIQGKGLLATEGVATIPWVEAGGCIPAVTSHFYEFCPIDGSVPRVSDELKKGSEYSLMITTGGGLYRYRLGDRVRVNGFHGSVPILEFVGRDNGVSDLRGEKLSPAFVQSYLDRATAEVSVYASFAMLAPQPNASRYVLYIQCPCRQQRLGEALETRLRANPHYDYCRSLGQLEALQIFWIRGDAQQIYMKRCAELGQRAGSVKPTGLHRSGGWEDYFPGDFAITPQQEFAHADR